MQIKNGKKFEATLQVVLLVISLFAISWMIGNSISVVDASDQALPGVGQSCGTGGICQKFSTIKNAGDSCTVGGKAGTVKVGLCAGDTTVRCCVPNAGGEEESKGGINPNAFAGWLSGGSNVIGLYKGLKTTTKPVVSTEEASVEKAIGSGGVVEKTLPGEGLESLFESTDKTPLILGGETFGGQIVATAGWTAVAFVLGRYVIGPALGLNVQQSQGLGYSLAAGTGAGFIAGSSTLLGLGALAGTGIGAAVAFVVSLVAIKNSSADIVTFNCYSWDSELGGKNCELCNNQEIPCTEYQCKSLGQGCELTIDEETGQALCEWENPVDIKGPVITTWEDALLDKELYRYAPDNTISPPNQGVKVEYTDSQSGCAPPWTPISFGITLDERARCKFSPGILFDDYDSMPDLFLSGSARLYNHSWSGSFQSKEALEAENLTLENGQNYEFYIRCQDSNGNSNAENFVVKFCIDDGPDVTAPLIRKTVPLDGTPFTSGQTEFDVTIFVNEPSQCRWSRYDQSYDVMENEFSCAEGVTQANAESLYPCSATLDGLKDNEENDFYFRCRDKPWLEGTDEEAQRNTNAQSYHFTLVGTEDLVIREAGPTGTIVDSTSPVEVEITAETALGYDDGKAICSLSQTGAEGSFIEFFYPYETERYSQHSHSQKINLGEGSYTYFVRCCDAANNCDEEEVNFNIETDTTPPEVVRWFKNQDYLNIVTNEDAKCVYSVDSELKCVYNFDEDGIPFISESGTYGRVHYTDWPENSQTTYYIKCEDQYGKIPSSGDCSTIVRPFEIPELK